MLASAQPNPENKSSSETSFFTGESSCEKKWRQTVKGEKNQSAAQSGRSARLLDYTQHGRKTRRSRDFFNRYRPERRSELERGRPVRFVRKAGETFRFTAGGRAAGHAHGIQASAGVDDATYRNARERPMSLQSDGVSNSGKDVIGLDKKAKPAATSPPTERQVYPETPRGRAVRPQDR